MKNYLLFLAAIALAVSCSGDNLTLEVPEEGESVLVDLSLEPSIPLTKSEGNNGEKMVNNVTILAFDSGGARLVYEKFKSTSIQNLYLPGKKNIRIYAIVNSPYKFENILDYSSFKTALSQFRYNTMRNFEMVGFVDTTLVSDCSLSIPVNRLASKLHIESIRINRNVGSPATKSIPTVEYRTLKAVYIMNVASTYPYSLERSTTTRFISMDESNPMIYHPMESSYTDSFEDFEDGRHRYYTYDEAMDFYLYPNTSESSVTRLVLYFEGTTLTAAEGGGYYVESSTDYYYIKLPELRPNTMYSISQLTIENPEYDTSPSSSDRQLDLRAEYSIDVMSASDDKVMESISKKEVAYAF